MKKSELKKMIKEELLKEAIDPKLRMGAKADLLVNDIFKLATSMKDINDRAMNFPEGLRQSAMRLAGLANQLAKIK